MIAEVLRRCLDELGKDSPRLDYVRGMVEVLLASQEKPVVAQIIPHYESPQNFHTNTSKLPTGVPMDEGQRMDYEAAAKIAKIKEMTMLS